MSIDLTALSMIGFFGLSGIVVNDSIILVSFHKELKRRGHPWRDSIVNATCLRLRAVLLTSLTAIGGLTPLLFETSVQAQFPIPMAVSVAFGLAFATFMVLLLVPALLALHESVAAWVEALRRPRARLRERITHPSRRTPAPAAPRCEVSAR